MNVAGCVTNNGGIGGLHTRIVWITLLAVMDEDGFCRIASPANIARLARVSPAAAVAALKRFEGRDPLSPEDENEGRRIERVAGGYIVLNAVKHREQLIREETRKQDAERARRYRERKRSVTRERDDVTEKRDAVMEVKTDITYLSRRQVRESIAAAVKETVERARALAAAPSSGVTVAPLSTIPTLDGDLKVAGQDVGPEADPSNAEDVHCGTAGPDEGRGSSSLFPRRDGVQILSRPRYPPRILGPIR
jgi:hypothetical protein